MIESQDKFKAWRLYDPITKNIIINIDVDLEEEENQDSSITKMEIQQVLLNREDKEDNEGEDFILITKYIYQVISQLQGGRIKKTTKEKILY